MSEFAKFLAGVMTAPKAKRAKLKAKRIEEDDPRWDWRTMGNRRRGPRTGMENRRNSVIPPPLKPPKKKVSPLRIPVDDFRNRA